MAEKKTQKRRTMRKSKTEKRGGNIKNCSKNRHRNQKTQRCRCEKVCKI